MKVVLLFLLLGLARAVEDEQEVEYQNELECDLDVECPKCHALYKVKAKFGPDRLDQQWLWDCKKVRMKACIYTDDNLSILDSRILQYL